MIVFRILHISDIHYSSQLDTPGRVDAKTGIGINSSQEEEFFKALEKYFNDCNNDKKINYFVISGDIINGWDRDAQKSFAQKFIELIKKYAYDKQNIVVVPGNHDVIQGSDMSSEKRYEEFHDAWKGCSLPYLDGVYKTSDIIVHNESMTMVIPINTSNWSQVQIKLPDVIKSHVDKLDGDIKKAFTKQFTYDAAHISEEQFTELRRKIKDIANYAGYKKIIVQHHHFSSINDSIEVKEMPDILNLEDLKDFIKEFDIKVLLHGHKHSRRAFYEYLNNDEKPYKLLISSSSNVKQNNFFNILSFDSFNVDIAIYNRKCEVVNKNNFNISNVETFNKTIVLEDNDISKLYEQVCFFGEIASKNNKQMTCHLNLTDKDLTKLPSIGNKNNHKKYEESIERYIHKYQKYGNMEIEDDNHGYQLYNYHGNINQIKYIVKSLQNSLTTSKAIATLVDPIKIANNDKPKFPSFISFHCLVRDGKYLDVIGHYRVQEMRHWWAKNISELFELQKKIINECKHVGVRLKQGYITTEAASVRIENISALGHSDISKIDYLWENDPNNIALIANGIFCKTNSSASELLNDIFEELNFLKESSYNNDGNAFPKAGLLKLHDCLLKINDNNDKKKNDFISKLSHLNRIIQGFSTTKSSEEYNKTLDEYAKEVDNLINSYKNIC